MRANEALLRASVDARLHQGLVLKATVDREHLQDPNRDHHTKYCVVLNTRCPDETIYVAFATSKTAHFDRNPRFESNIIRLPKGAYQWCVEPVTILDFVSVYPFRLEVLHRRYTEGHLSFEGDLSAADLNTMNKVLRHSRSIDPAVKRVIVAG
jgi:hypothetical protein